MKNLIIGGSGQLGKCFQENSDNNDWIVLNKCTADITELNSLKGNFEKYNPNYVINCAAVTNLEYCENNIKESMIINGLALDTLSELCNQYNCKLIHISTDHVFGGDSKVPYEVDDFCEPINIYGLSKLLAEKIVRKQCLNFSIIRIPWLIGKSGQKNFVTTVLKLAENRESINIVNDQFGSVIFCSELVSFILNSYKDINGIIHVSRDEIISRYDLAVIINDVLRLNLKIYKSSITNYNSKVDRPRYIRLSTKANIDSFSSLSIRCKFEESFKGVT